MRKEFTHEPDADRYVLRLDDEIASVLDYRVLGDAIAMTRAFTNPRHRGSGFAGELVAYAVDDVEATSARHVVPSCWYVAEWFDRHPERAALLRPRST
ncbi:GNAT family N-acetyltransferase [Agromyces allii]|uniref:N-acetyltransferase domain-containing protein n=1 Tax=Agromyces allii TaxID=393607 RepID=A0ABN2RBE9_9MICO|nr:GNAT family N-acetyltransferase [Agromyces allii]